MQSLFGSLRGRGNNQTTAFSTGQVLDEDDESVRASDASPVADGTGNEDGNEQNGSQTAQQSKNDMIEAARRGKVKQLQALVSGGANVNVADDVYGWSLLMHAAREGHMDAVKYLLSAGAAVNQTDKMGSTALHRAAFRGHYDVAKELLNNGADPCILDQMQQTAQQIAVQENHWRLAAKLNRAEAKAGKNKPKSDKITTDDVRRHQQMVKKQEEELMKETKRMHDRDRRAMTMRKKDEATPMFPPSMMAADQASLSTKKASATMSKAAAQKSTPTGEGTASNTSESSFGGPTGTSEEDILDPDDLTAAALAMHAEEVANGTVKAADKPKPRRISLLTMFRRSSSDTMPLEAS